METSNTSHQAPPTSSEVVPVNIASSAHDAPPTLAEPASGPVATMSGALQGSDVAVAPKPSVKDSVAAVNGSTEETSLPIHTSEQTAEPPSTPAMPPTSSADTAMKDETAPGAESEQAAPDANGTPAGSSKKQSNGKRKSTGAIPEHKNKKLNKKKSMQKITHLDAKPGDYYFARLKSYPPWPSIICDGEMLPQSLLSTRPVTTKKEDGTYRDDYADGGKKVSERTYPIMFLQTNEFAWIPNTDLSPLDLEELKGFPEKGKSKSLIGAYQVALEAHPLSFFKDMLLDHQRALQEDVERREAREAAKAAKAEKKKQKNDAAGDEDVDMEDADADDDAETEKPSKKRKKGVDSEGDDEKPSKTPKTTTKLKLTTPKAPNTTEKKSKDSAKPSKAKAEKKKVAKAEEDEDVVEENYEEPPKPVDPVEERKAREKEVLFLRHKLQKGFLSRDQAPQESEMQAMSNYIQKLEGYGPDLEASIIRITKINKVLKALIKLNTIPKDEEFNFRGRSVELLSKWNRLLGTTDDNGGKEDGEKEKDTPTTNGHKDDGAKADDEEKAIDAKAQLAEKPAELKDGVEKIEAAPETRKEAKEAVPEGLVQDATKQGAVQPEKAEKTFRDAKAEAPAAPAAEEMKIDEPMRLDQALVSAEAAGEAMEIATATE